MRTHRYLALVFLGLCVGCDSMVGTHLTVRPALAGGSQPPSEVLSTVRPVLQAEGFGEFHHTNGPPTSAVLFTDWFPGTNPNIWITVSCEHWPAGIGFREKYTAHRSHKHKQIVQKVERALEEHKFQVTRE